MIQAARALLAEGTTPTVETAAARCGVSRATAYRYFTNQRELLVATHPMLDMASLLPPNPPDDPTERVLIVAKRIIELIRASEAELRMSLRLSLEPGDREDLPLRKGRRLAWFEDALQPLRGDFTAGLLQATQPGSGGIRWRRGFHLAHRRGRAVEAAVGPTAPLDRTHSRGRRNNTPGACRGCRREEPTVGAAGVGRLPSPV